MHDSLEAKIKSEISILINNQQKYFPHSIFQDYYKLFYQAYFGPDHFNDSPEKVQNLINFELQKSDYHLLKRIPVYKLQLYETFFRIDLVLIKSGILSLNELTEAFINSCHDIRETEMDKWDDIWKEVIIQLSQKNISFTRNESQQIQKLHHSQKYMKNYYPHYRLINEEEFIKLYKNNNKFQKTCFKIANFQKVTFK
ncbi:MAG: hypothetical protein K8S23_15875 [Candidatus Cloacimonetes bacterium]|nr:hypothetical protein [Candidatus Cloacimonadota bacterium]